MGFILYPTNEMNSFILFNKHVVAFLVLSGHSVSPPDIFISSFRVFFRHIAFVSEQVRLKCLLCAGHRTSLCPLDDSMTLVTVWQDERVRVHSPLTC